MLLTLRCDPEREFCFYPVFFVGTPPFSLKRRAFFVLQRLGADFRCFWNILTNPQTARTAGRCVCQGARTTPWLSPAFLPQRPKSSDFARFGVSHVCRISFFDRTRCAGLWSNFLFSCTLAQQPFFLSVGTRSAVPGKSDTAATRGSRWWTGGFLLRLLERFQPLSDAFLLAFRVKLCKLLIVKLLDGELNGQERVQKTPVLFSTILRDDACVLRLNEAALDQLRNIFSHGVRTHIDCAPNRSVARMALIRCPILDVHQIAVDRQRAW